MGRSQFDVRENIMMDCEYKGNHCNSCKHLDTHELHIGCNSSCIYGCTCKEIKASIKARKEATAV
jgi:hypothetical protein